MKDQNDPPNEIAEVVDDMHDSKVVEARDYQPEEGEIPDPQIERTDSSLAIPSFEFQEAQKCALLGMNLSDSNQNSRTVNNVSTDSRTPKWGNEEEISKILINSEMALVIEMEWKQPKYRNKKAATPSTSLIRKSSRIAQVDVGYISSSPGWPSNHKVRDKEASKNIEDGTQKNLKELGIGK